MGYAIRHFFHANSFAATVTACSPARFRFLASILDGLVVFHRIGGRVVERFVEGNEIVTEVLLSATEELQRSPSLVRWRDYPTVAFMLPDLLIHHESLHVGQLSIWRRAAGL